MVAEAPILGDQSPAVLDRGGEDEAIGWITREGSGEGDRRRSDGRRSPDRPEVVGELIEPGADGHGDDDAVVHGKPGELELRDRCNRELVGLLYGSGCCPTQAIRFG